MSCSETEDWIVFFNPEIEACDWCFNMCDNELCSSKCDFCWNFFPSVVMQYICNFINWNCNLQFMINEFEIEQFSNQSCDKLNQYCWYRRNEERAQGVPRAPPIRSKIVEKGPKWSLFGVMSFMKMPPVSPKFRSKGAELFWAPPIL